MGFSQVYARWARDWWLFEIIAIAVSCALTITLCLVLSSFDGHETPYFGSILSWGIPLNTVVSLIGTLAVATSLSAVIECISQLKWLWFSNKVRPLRDMETFDQASRGLVGSLNLIWELRHTSIASIGAFCMVLHLAIVPLTQQSLQYEARIVSVNDVNATVSIATRWIEDRQQPQASSMPSGYNSLGLGMKGSIVAGLFTDPDSAINNTFPACLSGNCTFNDYQSLSIFWEAADVTDQLEDRSDRGNGKDNFIKCCITDDACLTFKSTFIRANMTSAAGNDRIKKPLSDSPGRTGGRMDLNFTSVAFKNRTSPIADVYVIYANSSNFSSDGTNFVAVEFVLDWCVPTFSTSVVNGTATSFRRSCTPETLELGTTKLSHEVGDDTFSVDLPTHLTLQRHLDQLLSGTIRQGPGQYDADSDVVQVFGRALHIMGDDEASSLEPGLPMLDAVLANSDAFVNGTVYAQRNFVSVSWGWLSALLTYLTLCLIFCIITISQYRHAKVEVKLAGCPTESRCGPAGNGIAAEEQKALASIGM
ncbi:hypothetical protein NM208_g8091 [Fusarium decemcellulare]|uniref:Uncharacterized protein n=1 Tax=Fusarium decemcellulare TaxID=57161 RepID=A0ACC1S6L0_9HYPO|nr:hypothetical protein NM208_g8091 [Fusarium decemcellulare]